MFGCCRWICAPPLGLCWIVPESWVRTWVHTSPGLEEESDMFYEAGLRSLTFVYLLPAGLQYWLLSFTGAFVCFPFAVMHSIVCFFYPLLDNLVVLSLGLLLLFGGQMHRLQIPDAFRCLGSSCSKLYNTISLFYGRTLVFHIVLYGNFTHFDITIVYGTSATGLLWFHTYYCKVYEVFTIVVICATITHPNVKHGLPPKEIPYPVIAEESTLPFLWQLECVSIFLLGKEGDQVLSIRQRYQVVLAKVLDIG